MDRRPLSSLVVVLLAACLTAGCAYDGEDVGAGSVAQAQGAPRPCPEPDPAKEEYKPAVETVAAKVARLGNTNYRSSYTGLTVCVASVAASAVNVFRVPDKAFDRAVRKIGIRYDVPVAIVDTRYARAELGVVEKEIWARRPALSEQGVRISHTSISHRGHLEVGVQKGRAAAQRALAAYGDKVRIVAAVVGVAA